ncbi:MAG: hypothetical protein BWY24_00296 [Microgenomates group bacterium ADurb.Bin219]|nr:MAG: hypothetical protein BWY24_00296 [Microgenomates group bacterium ADurb.Bin219]HNP89392.1 hypothetical protein [Candidatus Woesebacteria bacterium]
MENLTNFLLSANVWLIAKFFVLLAFFVYACFAFILVRQVSMMIEVVVTNLGSLIKMISIGLLIVAIAAFIAMILFL